MRRSLAGLVLLLLVVVVVYVWLDRSGNLRAWHRPVTAPPSGELREDAREIRDQTKEGARDLRAEAKSFGAEAREKLSEAGRELKDAKVTASVKTALSLNRTLRPYAIDVRTDNGLVTLTGRVSNAEERARAEEVAAAVPDVTRVVDQLQVGGASGGYSGRTLGERFDDEKIEVGVKLALSLTKDLGGTDVTVQAFRHEVTLGGEVATEAQHREALRIARDTASVTKVIDNVRVRGAAAAARPANPSLSGFRLEDRVEVRADA